MCDACELKAHLLRNPPKRPALEEYDRTYPFVARTRQVSRYALFLEAKMEAAEQEEGE